MEVEGAQQRLDQLQETVDAARRAFASNLRTAEE